MGMHTFLFADLVGFSALTELHGDDVAADLAVRFGAEASRLAAEHGGTVVKSLGDAVMIRVRSAADGVRLGMRLHDELEGLPPVHAGAHTGRAVERAGDWYGSAVNLAARVADVARGGELLMTEATRSAAGALRGIELDPLGHQTFKNITGETALYSARWARPEPRASVPRLDRLGGPEHVPVLV